MPSVNQVETAPYILLAGDADGVRLETVSLCRPLDRAAGISPEPSAFPRADCRKDPFADDWVTGPGPAQMQRKQTDDYS